MDKDFYRLIIHEFPAGYAYHKIILDEQGHPSDYEFLEANQAFQDITGLNIQDIAGKTIRQIMPNIAADSFPWIDVYAEVALQRKKLQIHQYSKVFNKWFHVTVFSPEKYYFITLFSDISDEMVKKFDLEDFFSINLDLLCITEANGKSIHVNPEWENVTGYPTSEIQKNGILGYVHPDDFEITKKMIHILSNGQNAVNFTTRIRCKDGSYRYVNWRCNSRGNRIYSSGRDITDTILENRGFEIILNASEEFLRVSSENIDYMKITDTALTLSEAKYVAFNLYNKDGTEFVNIAFSGPTEDILSAGKALGFDLMGKSWPAFIYDQTHMHVNMFTFFDDLRSFSDGLFPYEFIEDTIAKYSVGQIVVAKIEKDNKIMGDFIFFMPAGKPFRQHTFVQIYTKLTGLLLNRVDSEKQMEEAKDRIFNNLRQNQIMVKVLRHFGGSEQEYLQFALEQALELTQSQYGYMYLYDEAAQSFQLNCWSRKALEDCGIEDKYKACKTKPDGLWGEVVRLKKPLIVNNFSAPEQAATRFPPGHVNIKKYLSIPIFDNNKIIAVVGFANKISDYTENDVLQLTLLMNNVWISVQKKRSEDSLKREKNLFKTTLLSIGDGILATDLAGNIIVINEIAQSLTGRTKANAIGAHVDSILHLVNENTGEATENPVKSVLETACIVHLDEDTALIACDESKRPISGSAAPIIDEDGELQGVVFAFRDITAEKKKRTAIEYLSFHDQLTGLYNRAYFEEEMKTLNQAEYLPLTLIMADVNGLKLANDAFGHHAGDVLLQKAAKALQSGCRQQDLIARIGGDEFIVVLKNTTKNEAEKIVHRIRELCASTDTGSVSLSISFGWDTKTKPNDDISLIQKRAEDKMYRRKLFESPSVRGKTFSAIVQTLYETHKREELHSKRVSRLCEAICESINLTEREFQDIVNAALLHDIGKIAIDGRILNKVEPLTSGEWRELKRHPEIGYRILSSVHDMADMAEYVLAHHERWDGTGYPKGLNGEDIPLPSRVIAIADAYDSMITDTPYRNALSKDEALQQIQLGAGTQFDPELCNVFLSLYKK